MKWHALELRSQPAEESDWKPAETPLVSDPPSEDDAPVTRRRPGRRRKKRPQAPPDREYQDEERPVTRPRRPQRLDQENENWKEEMLAEEPFRPMRVYNRRRLYPKYEEDGSNEPVTVQYEESNDGVNQMQAADETKGPERVEMVERVRDPYTALNEENKRRRRPFNKQTKPEESSTESAPSTSPGPIDLKALLKKAGGISLSELLQQKNLSLADLLKGEQHAISALTATPDQNTEVDKVTTENPKPKRHGGNYRRIPPSLNRRKTHSSENETVENTTKENADTQKRRLPPIYNENRLMHTVKAPEVLETTTEKRIFVPSHPKLYTSVNYKPYLKNLHINNSKPNEFITEAPTETTTINLGYLMKDKKVTTRKPYTRNTLPPTLAKLKSLVTKTVTKTISSTENYPIIPLKAFKIDINELFGINTIINDTKTNNDEPLKISVNIKEMFEQSSQETENPNNNSIDTKIFKNVKEQQKPENEKPVEINVTKTAQKEKTKQETAKAEIMEVLSDNKGRKNLTRVLKSRNMTLEELIQLRERGSSQRHLADIFHNQTKEPEPREELTVDQIVPQEIPILIPSLFDMFSSFDIKPENRDPKLDSSKIFLNELSKTRESRQNPISVKEVENVKIITEPIFDASTESNDIENLVPLWRQAFDTINRKHQRMALTDRSADEIIFKDDSNHIDEIESKLSNGGLNVDLSHHKLFTEDDFLQLPHGVRSAVIASAIIIGISLLVFFTIFITFKWTQKKRKRLTYCNSFSSNKIRSPFLENPYQRRLFNSLLNATLGRKKKISTISGSEPHSIQDYLWENDRKPFQ